MSESSPAAWRFAIPDRTAFCFLLTGLLNIDSALTLISFAGRDDSDDFFFAISILHARYVNNQQNRPLCGSNGVPPLFAGHDAILTENYVGIVENQCRTLESDATVLMLVDSVLFTVPFEPHCYTKCITITVQRQRPPTAAAAGGTSLLSLDAPGSGVPVHRLLPEKRFVGHVAGDGGVVAENGILHHRFPRLDRPEEVPEMGLDVVPIVAAIDDVLHQRLLAERDRVLGKPLLDVGVAHLLRKTPGVVAGRRVFPKLPRQAKVEFPGIENTFRAHEASQLGGIRP